MKTESYLKVGFSDCGDAGRLAGDCEESIRQALLGGELLLCQLEQGSVVAKKGRLRCSPERVRRPRCAPAGSAD